MLLFDVFLIISVDSIVNNSGTITFGGRTIAGLYVVDDAALSNQTKLNVVFNGTSDFNSGWNSVTVGGLTRNRSAFGGNVLNGVSYIYTTVLGNANFTNPLPNGSTKTITFN